MRWTGTYLTGEFSRAPEDKICIASLELEYKMRYDQGEANQSPVIENEYKPQNISVPRPPG